MKIDEICSYLEKRRKSLGISQKDLAELCGISIHALSNLERGCGNPTLKNLLKVAETLGITISAGVKRI